MDAMSILAKVKEDMKGTVAKIEAKSAGIASDALGKIADTISSAKKEVSTSIPGAQAKLDAISSGAKKALLSTSITNMDTIVTNVEASVSEVVSPSKQTINKDKTTTAVYEFILSRTNILDKSLPHITDFQYIAFIRDPIKTQAVIIDMQAMIPDATLDAIKIEHSKKIFPEYELTCYQIKDVDKSNEADTNIKEKLYSTFVVIIKCEPQKDNTVTSRTTAEGSIPCRMILENPIAWQMSVNTFNAEFLPYETSDHKPPHNPKLIALETIINNNFNPQISDSQMSSFTDYVINKYAGNSKTIKQIVLADKNTVNLYNYENITIPPTIPEINVPEYINNTYKPFSTSSFWFFDSFNFGNYDKNSKPDKGKIPIWVILINFFNCYHTFEKIDISKDSNITTFTHLLKSEAFADTESILDRPNAVITFTNRNMALPINKKMGSLPKTLMADNTTKTQDSRMTSLSIYCPEEYDTKPAEKRILDCVEIFHNHIDLVELYETTNTTPDWLQFGKLYNLEKDPNTGINTNDYIHTPIYIVNIFKRRQMKDATLECINKYAMLRLIKPKGEIVSKSEPTPYIGFEPEPVTPPT